MLAVSMAGLIGGCGGGGDSESGIASIDGPQSCEQRDGGSLRIGVTDGLATFDINKNAIGSPTLLNAEALVFDRLIRPSPDLGRLENRLATSVKPNANFTEWTIKLRPGVKFHDGSSLDAEDVVFTINYYLKGANGFALGPVSNVEAIRPLEVRVELAAPYAQFNTEALSAFLGSIVPADFGGMDPAAFWRKPIGTGPYMVESFRPGSTIKFKRFPGYWDAGKPHIDEIEMRVVSDPNDRMLGLEGGEYELVDRVPADASDTLSGDTHLRAIDPSATVDALFLTSRSSLLKDAKVRQAMFSALNRQAVVDGAYNGLAEATTQFVPPALPDVPKQEGAASGFDLDRAKNLIAGSSFPEGGDIDMIYVKGDASLELEAQIVKDQLSKIGIDTNLVALGFAEAFDRVQRGDYDLFVFHGEAVVIDPVDYLGFYADTKGYYGNWPTAPVEKMLGAFTAAAGSAERTRILTEYGRFSNELAAQIPIAIPFWLDAQSEKLSGMDISPINEWYLSEAWLCE